MPRVDPDRWRAVSPCLDRALDLEGEQERTASLREQNPALADDVEALIKEMDGLRDTRFLDDTTVPLPLRFASVT
jgi:hypothetical protein